MSEVEFKVSATPVTVSLPDGSKHQMRFPLRGESRAFQEALKSGKEEEASRIYEEFFLKLGLPQQVIDDLTADYFIKLMQFLVSGGLTGDGKKKS